jgi:hypothetical protein
MYGNRYNVAEIERENVDIRIDEYLHRFENVREQLARGARLERDGSEPSSNSQAENLKSETKSVSLQQPHSDEARDQGRTFQ